MTDSNFEAFLKAEKAQNLTLDFRTIYKQLENLCVSHAILLLNHKKIIDKLLKFLDSDESMT